VSIYQLTILICLNTKTHKKEKKESQKGEEEISKQNKRPWSACFVVDKFMFRIKPCPHSHLNPNTWYDLVYEKNSQKFSHLSKKR